MGAITPAEQETIREEKQRRTSIIKRILFFLTIFLAVIMSVMFNSIFQKPGRKLGKNMLRRTKELPTCFSWCRHPGIISQEFTFSQRLRCYGKCLKVTYTFPMMHYFCSSYPLKKISGNAQCCKDYATNTRIDAKSYVGLRYFYSFSSFVQYFLTKKQNILKNLAI